MVKVWKTHSALLEAAAMSHAPLVEHASTDTSVYKASQYKNYGSSGQCVCSSLKMWTWFLFMELQQQAP